jgi:predicted HTH transcriptional regulator
MKAEDLMRLIAAGENEALELKSALLPARMIARNLAALANTRGGALVIGVEEPQRIVGVDVGAATRLTSAAIAMLEPPPVVRAQDVEIEGQHVFVIEVEKSASLVAAQGATYWRTGDQIRPLQASEVKTRALEGRTQESALTELSRVVAAQTQTIERLTTEFNKVNSIWRKLGLAAGGAVLGALAKYAVDHFLP